jgi:hypothetical protein
MPEKNKDVKKRTSKSGDVKNVTETKTRKTVIKQAKARAKELCKLG